MEYKTKPKKYLLSFILCVFLSGGIFAQAVSFEAYADARQTLLNSYFELSFTLKNADGNNFRPPSLNEFTVVNGPGRSASTTIINGAVSKSLSYTYTLQPKKLGRFTIGAARIRVGNKEYRTQPITIEVIEGKEGATSTGEGEYFVKAEPSVEEAWVGQQIILSYNLYTTVNIDNYNVIEESDYSGFFAEDIRRINTRVARKIIDGTQYATKLLRQVAIYPQQAGELTIDPMQVQLGLVMNDSRRRSSFFFNRQVKRVPVQTEPISIRVQSLPKNAPPSFTGAVGRYKMTVNLNRGELTTDDVAQLTLTISGDGDIKRVQPPKISFPESFEAYDPKVIDESSYENGERIIGKKVIEYLALPQEAGVHTLQPDFSYFDPDSARYITINTRPFRLRVEQGSARPKRSLETEPEKERMQDINYIELSTKISRANSRFFGSPGFWSLIALPFLGFIGAVFFKRYLRQKAGIDPLLLRARRARKVAMKRLQMAEKYLQAKESKAFYDEISKAMLGYVCDKLQIPLSELTKDNVKAKLQSLQAPETLIDRFMQIIGHTEIALFAGMDQGAAMEETYQKTLEVLMEMEQAAG